LAPKATKEIQNYLNSFADRAFAKNFGEKSSQETLTLIGDLIQKGKSRKDVKNAVTATLLAGKDPTTTTMAWGYYEIARHPEVFTKMKAEVEEW
jgi:cytochrome P450